MKGLLAQSRLVALVDGVEHEVVIKPRHVKALQQRFNGDATGEMEQTMFLCWIVLHEQGVFPGTVEEFDLALDDIGVPEGDGDNPKV